VYRFWHNAKTVTSKRPTTDDTPPASTKARSVLIDKIKAVIAANRWTQQHAANLCGLTQPRISNLVRNNVSRFSLDALVNITAALERHSLPQERATMESTEEEGQRLVAEFMAKLAAKPVKASYPVATEASTTKRGGKIIATCDIFLRDKRIALVGDIVRYPDGSEARIVSGAGVAWVVDGRPAALVGTALDNGDQITGPIHNDSVIIQYADEFPIDGLFDPSFILSAYQGALHG
jgi:predicted XRE-type DNA-binding protein/uncharacterized Zn-binding protein involved in type VI secretion